MSPTSTASHNVQFDNQVLARWVADVIDSKAQWYRATTTMKKRKTYPHIKLTLHLEQQGGHSGTEGRRHTCQVWSCPLLDNSPWEATCMCAAKKKGDSCCCPLTSSLERGLIFTPSRTFPEIRDFKLNPIFLRLFLLETPSVCSDWLCCLFRNSWQQLLDRVLRFQNPNVRQGKAGQELDKCLHPSNANFVRKAYCCCSCFGESKVRGCRFL